MKNLIIVTLLSSMVYSQTENKKNFEDCLNYILSKEDKLRVINQRLKALNDIIKRCPECKGNLQPQIDNYNHLKRKIK